MDAQSEANLEPRTLAARLGTAARGYAPRIAVSLVIAGGFAWVFHRGGLPLIPSAEALHRVTIQAVLAYASLTILGMVFRTHRWLHLLRPIAPQIPSRRVFGIGLVGFTAIFFAPLRMGEIVRPYLLAQDGQVSFVQAIGTVAAERIVDGLVLTLACATALSMSTPISPLPNHLGSLPIPVSAVPHAVYGALAAFVAGFIAMSAFYFSRALARRVTQRVLGVFSERLANFATATLERLADGFSFLPSSRSLSSFLWETLVYWGCCVAAQWLLLRGCGVDASPVQACVVLGVMGLGSLIPAGPGFFGAYQIATYTGLALFFPGDVLLLSGAAVVFVSYAAQLILTALSCLVGFWLMRAGRVAEQGIGHGV